MKRNWILNKLVIILFGVCLTGGLFAQDDLYDHGLDQGKWERIREGIRYEGGKKGAGRQWTYESKEEYDKAVQEYGHDGNGGNGQNGDGSGNRNDNRQRVQTEKKSAPIKPKSSFQLPSFSGLGVFGYILIGLFIAGLIVLLYYMFINTQFKGKKIKATPTNFEEIDPTEIPLTELERLLQDALAKKDYRGAVRIYFIFIVRDLAQKNWIKWEKDKTNFHYLREMEGKSEFEDFNTSVNYFEIIWYGKREIDASKFDLIRPKFTRFLDKLGVK